MLSSIGENAYVTQKHINTHYVYMHIVVVVIPVVQQKAFNYVQEVEVILQADFFS